MRELERSKLTDEQRENFLAAIRENPNLGSCEALRRAGVTGGATALPVRKSEATRIINADPDLKHDYEIARGRDIDKVEGRVFELALDADPKIASSNAQFLLKYRHPAYAQRSEIDVNHTGDLTQAEDRSASLADVARVLEAVGALAAISSGTARPTIPDAPKLLAQPPKS